VGAVLHLAELAGVDEEDLLAAVAEAVVPLVACVESKKDRDLGGVEELTRQRDQAVHEVGLDDILADLAPSPEVLEDMEPLASTNPARPVGAKWWMMC
jgi:hypothetical protein